MPVQTAECVSPMHPDKICDRISDAIVDACLKDDPNSRCAIETSGGHGIITITGELTTNAYVDIPAIVHRIAGENIGVQVNLVKQSQEIAQGVDEGGAGDQGIMVGFATKASPTLMPLEHHLARSLCQFLYDLCPQDGKTQVTIEDGKVKHIVVSWCKLKKDSIIDLVKEWANVDPVADSCITDASTISANPAGDWSTGGFDADSGVTGRKIVVDAYGPHIPVGGGAFSGKDGTKVDRSGAYMARRIAVNLLSQNDADSVKVNVAYAIGKPLPVMATAQIRKGEIFYERNLDEYIDFLSPENMIAQLGLTLPQFEDTAEWGAFGHGFVWDQPFNFLDNK